MLCKKCGCELVKGVCPNCSKFEKKYETETKKKPHIRIKKSTVEILAISAVIITVITACRIFLFGNNSNKISTVLNTNDVSQNNVTSYGTPEYYFANISELIDEYEANSLAALNRYRGRYVSIRGVVVDIDRDVLTYETYLLVIDRQDYTKICKCNFKFGSDTDNLVRLRTGDEITVVGKVGDYLTSCLEITGCKIVNG